MINNLKSILTELYENLLEIYIIEENVDEDEETKTLLKNYYDNPKKYAIIFQKWILKDKIKQFRKIFQSKNTENNKQIFIIFDRSLKADYKIFCSLQYELGNISKNEFEEYELFYQEIEKEYKQIIENCGIIDIYINTAVNICIKRIKKRLREGEIDKISESYLNNLNEKYNDFYKNYKNIFDINGNEEITQINKYLIKIVNKLFIQEN